MAITPNLGMKVLTDGNFVGMDDDLMPNFDIVDAYAGTIKDKIIDRGTTGIWEWRKYESGVMECDGRAEFTIPVTTPYGSGFYGTITNLCTFPAGFIGKPKVWLYGHRTSGSGSLTAIEIASGAAITATGIGVTYPYALSSVPSMPIEVFINAKGRWK